MHYVVVLFSIYLAVVRSQQVGTQTDEIHPNLSIQQCATGGNCQTLSTSITIDANWRSLHTTSGTADCYTGNTWNVSVCPDPITCAKNCALDGANYTGSYGIASTGSALTIKLVTHGLNATNVGSRMYLMANNTNYQMFNLQNQEFAFDVDVSNLPCGLNGALYFVQMDPDGGLSKYPNNKAGATYGTGYCDAQCPKGVKFINGEGRFHFVSLFKITSYLFPILRLTFKAHTAHAAVRWTFGRQTPMRRSTLPTYALFSARLAALVAIAVAAECVMRVAVASIHTAWATRLFSAWEIQLTPALNSPL
jgi:hypothetical protein